MRQLAAVLAFLFIAGGLFAADDLPRFLIERIEVRDTRHVSPAIVRAETRLVEGKSYTEADLREASYRVARLPFVVDAQYSLEKGSRRDSYVFVIAVRETKPLFFDADLNAWFGEGTSTRRSDLLLGGRLFAGSRGVFHAAVGTVNDLGNDNYGGVRSIEAGYTQYDLFGTRAFATLNATSSFHDSFTRPGVSLMVGVPVSASQTLAARAAHTTYSSSREGGYSSRSRDLGLTWSYITTDSPFFPTRGERVGLTASRYRADTEFSYRPNFDTSYTSTAYDAEAAKYWPLSGRDALSADANVHYVRTEQTTANPPSFLRGRKFSDDYETATIRFSHSLFDEKRRRASGDNFVQLVLGAQRYTVAIWSPITITDPNAPPPVIEPELVRRIRPNIGASWARRNAWGILRVGATYQW